MFYTGTGSKTPPTRILELMTDIGHYMASKNIKLRSGGDVGAETAFQEGCQQWCKNNNKRYRKRQTITIPENNYNNNKVKKRNGITTENHWLSYDISIEEHPKGKYFTTQQVNLIERSVTHVFGTYGISSSLIILWDDGQDNMPCNRLKHCIYLAEGDGIPIYNLYNKDDRNKIINMIRE